MPKAQACFFIRNDKTAIREGLHATLAIFTSVLQPESHWEELKIPSASSWYFIKRSKLCPRSGHYIDQVLLMTCMVGSHAERQPHIHSISIPYSVLFSWEEIFMKNWKKPWCSVCNDGNLACADYLPVIVWPARLSHMSDLFFSIDCF